MRDYEVVYIFRPELESEEVDDRLESYHDRLDGEITALEHWGQRELAFEIAGERRGYYAVAQFRAEPASLQEFEQALDLDEDLIRHLLVVSEGELAVPPSQRQEEEDEEEADEEEAEGDEDEADEEEAEEEEDEDEREEDDGEDEEEGDEDEEEASPEEDEDEEGDEKERDDGDAEDAGDGDEADEEPADEPDDEER